MAEMAVLTTIWWVGAVPGTPASTLTSLTLSLTILVPVLVLVLFILFSASSGTHRCDLRLILRRECRLGFIQVGCSGSGYGCHRDLFGGQEHPVSGFEDGPVGGGCELTITDVGANVHR